MNEDKQLINIENNPLNVNRYGEYELRYSSDRYTIQDNCIDQYTILDKIGIIKESQSILSDFLISSFEITDKNEIDNFLSFANHLDLLEQNLDIVKVKSTLGLVVVHYDEDHQPDKYAIYTENTIIEHIIDRIPYSANPIVNFETISSESEIGEIELSNRIEEISYMKIDPEFNNGKIVQNYMKEYEDVEVIATGLSSFNWHQQNKYIENINFGNTVVQIGAEAFKDNLAMSSLTIPSWIKYIGKDAFANTNMVFDSVNFVERTEEEISSMENYPWGLVNELPTIVYYRDGSLSSFKISKELKWNSIPNKSNIVKIDIGHGIKSIGNNAFSSCYFLSSVTIPDSVTNIGSGVFYGCYQLTSITIPDSVKNIGNGAFQYCSKLKSISIPSSIVKIENNTFSGCYDLTSVTIPSSVTSIDTYAFVDSGLETIIVDSNNQVYDSRNNCNAIIRTANNKLITGCKNTVIPNTIKVIGTDAFMYCSELTSITIPNGVTVIEWCAFGECSGLTSLTIPSSVTEISLNAFNGCSGLKSITVDSNNQVYDSRNNCNAIIKTSSRQLILGCKNTIIPNTVTSIENGAFFGCSELTSITIPNSVANIRRDAFNRCSKLTSITIPNSIKSIDDFAFSGCSGMKSVTINNGISSIGDYVFENCSSLTSIIIPDSVTEIGDDVFNGCSELLSVTLPNNITNIGIYMFNDCSKLTAITIPNNVTVIKYGAFYNCARLASITIPNAVKSVEDYAFYGCSGIKSVSFGNGLTSIGIYAFTDCSGLTSITFPNSLTSIGRYAFYKCSGIKSVTFGNGLTDIGEYAFAFCYNLTSLTIPDSVTNIGNKAFCECFNLTLVSLPALFREKIDLIGIPSTCEVIFRPLWDECTKSSNWAGSNASTRYMNILSPGLSNSEFKNRVNWIKNTRQCNCAHVFITNKGDGEYAGYSPYGNPSGSGAFGYAVAYTGIDKTYTNEMTSRIKYLYEQGLGIVLWLMADDSTDWANDLSRGATMTKYCADIKSLGWFNYASTVVIGLEVEEYWNNETTINTLISTLRKYYTGKIGVHHGSNSYSLGKNADIHFVQLNPGQSDSTIRSYVNTVKSATGKPVNMFELERNPDRQRSQVALDAGAYGVGNW